MSFPPYTAAPTTSLSPLLPYPTQLIISKPPISINNPPKNHLFLKPTTAIDPTVSWTSIISRHCRNGSLSEAITAFTQMRLAEVDPNHIAFISLLSACANSPSQTLSLGQSLHAYVCKLGLNKNNVKVGTTIVGFYSKKGRVDLARLGFNGILFKNNVTWNTMLDGYMRNGFIENALQLFDEMSQRDAVSWTAMIGGFLKSGDFEKALEMFVQMQLSGINPDYVAIVSILSACANLGVLGLGLWVHKFVIGKRLENNVRISNSLIDMYSRCGCIDFASHVFENMRFRTLVSWNSMIGGFSMNGYANEALEFFHLMQKEGFEPNEVSFTGALAACSHSGLVDEGLNLFDQMIQNHKISPRIEHYGCIIDLYSRAGRLEDALNVIKNMPMIPNEVILGSLLAACATRGNVDLAESLIDCLLELDPRTDSNYVLLSNIYAAVGSWDGANNVRNRMKNFGIKKRPGISSIEVDCSVHEFTAGDKSHTETERINAMLELLHLEVGLNGSFSVYNLGELHDYD